MDVETISQLIKQITRSDEDAYQETWLRILETNTTDAHGIQQIATRICKRRLSQTISDKHRLLSLEAPTKNERTLENHVGDSYHFPDRIVPVTDDELQTPTRYTIEGEAAPLWRWHNGENRLCLRCGSQFYRRYSQTKFRPFKLCPSCNRDLLPRIRKPIWINGKRRSPYEPCPVCAQYLLFCNHSDMLLERRAAKQ